MIRRLAAGAWAHGKAARGDRRRCDDLEVILGPEVADFEFAQADNAERGRLDATDSDHTANAGTEQRFRGRAGQRQVEDLVCLLTRHCRLVERAQITVRLELCEGLPQGFWVLSGKQGALHAAAISEMVEDLLADELPFAVAIGCQDHLIAGLERRGDGLEFRRLVAVCRGARRIEAVRLQERA